MEQTWWSAGNPWKFKWEAKPLVFFTKQILLLCVQRLLIVQRHGKRLQGCAELDEWSEPDTDLSGNNSMNIHCSFLFFNLNFYLYLCHFPMKSTNFHLVVEALFICFLIGFLLHCPFGKIALFARVARDTFQREGQSINGTLSSLQSSHSRWNPINTGWCYTMYRASPLDEIFFRIYGNFPKILFFFSNNLL